MRRHLVLFAKTSTRRFELARRIVQVQSLTHRVNPGWYVDRIVDELGDALGPHGPGPFHFFIPETDGCEFFLVQFDERFFFVTGAAKRKHWVKLNDCVHVYSY
jgi:hypothetical protein